MVGGLEIDGSGLRVPVEIEGPGNISELVSEDSILLEVLVGPPLVNSGELDVKLVCDADEELAVGETETVGLV